MARHPVVLHIFLYMSRAVVSYGYETYTEDPLKMMLVSLQRGFECLLSTWESAFVQSVDDYKVLLSCRAIRFTPNPQENWKYYRMGLVTVFTNYPFFVRGALSPSLHWYSVHSGMSTVLLVTRIQSFSTHRAGHRCSHRRVLGVSRSTSNRWT